MSLNTTNTTASSSSAQPQPQPAAAMSRVKRTITKFNGQNYAIWAFHVKNILKECGLEKLIEDPASGQTHDQDDDQKALAEICFTLADSQMTHILTATTAREAWRTLRDIHEHTSDSNR